MNKKEISVSKKNISLSLLICVALLLSCDKDDPKPVNEEEVITTIRLSFYKNNNDAEPEGVLKFYDADGDGSIAPVISLEKGNLYVGRTYTVDVELLNEQETPAENVTLEIAEEAEDHLFCFNIVSGVSEITYNDKDANGNPIGLSTTWKTTNGTLKVTVTLRHQPGTKTGTCPGTGDTDIEVTFETQLKKVA